MNGCKHWGQQVACGGTRPVCRSCPAKAQIAQLRKPKPQRATQRLSLPTTRPAMPITASPEAIDLKALRAWARTQVRPTRARSADAEARAQRRHAERIELENLRSENRIAEREARAAASRYSRTGGRSVSVFNDEDDPPF